MKYYNKLIFEMSKAGRIGFNIEEKNFPEVSLPTHLLRSQKADLPEVSELDVVRHYTNVSQKNFGVENGFYPLGSCTMKYNPKINDELATLCGFETVEIKSNPDGTVNLEALKSVLNDETAGLMLTNPNTAGVFEKDITEIARLVHDAGGLLYYDGANLNALVGKAKPGDMGFDITHINLHKTFSTPHGGGGPGSGPVGVCEKLVEFLPNPVVRKNDKGYYFDQAKDSIGALGLFFGNASVYIRAYVYIMTFGKEHLSDIGPMAVLNANYVKDSLKDLFELPINGHCLHEFVFDGLKDQSTGVKTLDLAKRLLDYGFHAPTVYFPLIFTQSMMIEPTEVESKETLDEFIHVMRKIVQESIETPELVKTAPHNTIVRRLDEAKAARQPIVKFKDIK